MNRISNLFQIRRHKISKFTLIELLMGNRSFLPVDLLIVLLSQVERYI